MKFISITVDGATDISIKEQESISIRACHKGEVHTMFAALVTPRTVDAEGVTNAIIEGCKKLLPLSDLKKKVIGFGADGASLNFGRWGGVAVRLQRDYQMAQLLPVHCFNHRLGLAYRDAMKSSKIYKQMMALLIGLYYFYHNSSKRRKGLRVICQAMGNPLSINPGYDPDPNSSTSQTCTQITIQKLNICIKLHLDVKSRSRFKSGFEIQIWMQNPDLDAESGCEI